MAVMKSTSLTPLPSLTEAAHWRPQQVVDLARSHRELMQQIEALKHQLDWFRRQIFGQKSEKRPIEIPLQMSLGEAPEQDKPASPEPTRLVPAHHRRMQRNGAEAGDESGLFFDAAKVPVEVIHVPNPDIAGLEPDQYEVIGEKVSHRLAQRPGSYVVLKYVRPLIKRLDTQTLSCPPAPVGVLEGSRADVSFVAGLLLDKFAYHLPLYRQHQRLLDAGFKLSRPWLTQVASQGVGLLEPIYEAQLASIRASRIKAMDETPIKAGRAEPGKLKGGYFWPIYGELDEDCFPFFDSRAHANVEKALGLTPVERGVLLSDGYAAYAQYAGKTGLTHAQCWAHTRRKFIEAERAEPALAAQALDQIAAIYAIEAQIRGRKRTGEKKREDRLIHSKPLVEQFFGWVQTCFNEHGLLPSSPMTTALAYARERRLGLEVFLTDPEVPIDTNHLERALRAIPMGRKAWLFCWTELGAKHVGIVQSLIVTCRLHGIDPYDYLVDVLQRVGQHPAADVAQLTPRLWKERFTANPLRSDVHGLLNQGRAPVS
jgi:transposase